MLINWSDLFEGFWNWLKFFGMEDNKFVLISKEVHRIIAAGQIVKWSDQSQLKKYFLSNRSILRTNSYEGYWNYLLFALQLL